MRTHRATYDKVMCFFGAPAVLALFVASIVGAPSNASAQAKEEISPTVLYQAIDVLVSYLEEDLTELSKVTKKTAIVNYTQSEELPESVKAYLIKKLERAGTANANHPVRFVQCIECLTVRAEAEGDEVFIKKGITDTAELNSTLERMGVRKYGDVNLTYGGKFVSLQMSVVDRDGSISWSQEYKTPYNAVNDSQWMLGAGIEALAFMNPDLPTPQAARLYFGQRLFGIGAVGLSGVLTQKSDDLSAINTFSGFFELSHNEFFQQYWEFVQLSYVTELGITDFNGNQQLAESVGIKTKFGQYFTLRLMAGANQFINKPKDDSPIFNPKGEPILNNNDPLPARFALGIGFELL
jgi:hypothetical protein